MFKLSSLIVIILTNFTFSSSAQPNIKVADINKCPPLASRPAPVSVHDLRPDDIKVIGAFGDSFTAGYSIKVPDYNVFSPLILKEYRGLSYSIGGDEGAVTIPNFLKHYQCDLNGYSTGEHLLALCDDYFCDDSYYPDIDVLNAALSGAGAFQLLNHEISYLIKRMQALENVDFENDWKMINIQIGGNDMCRSCDPAYEEETLPDKYGEYVEAVVNIIQANIPKVLVNLIDNYNTTQLFSATEGKAYCNGLGSVPNKSICPCSYTKEGLDKLIKLSAAYNKKLIEIYKKHQRNKRDDFAVVYQQINLNVNSCPPEFFNHDCFHPSVVGHEWLAKAIWNQLFIPHANKPKVSDFSYDEPIYCPTDSDRFVTY